MFYLFLIIALLIIASEVFSARANKRTKQTGTVGKEWLRVYRWRWLTGIPFAVASAFIYYPMSGKTETYKVLGFPLFVAAFDEAGRDYVGPFTGPFFIGNAVIWFFIPHFFLSVWAYFSANKKRNG